MNYAMLFPGQGSQSVGMLGGFAAPVVAQTFDEASAVLGWDVGALVREGPEQELNRTQRTQPALLAADIALWRLWQQRGLPPPTALAGHSLGEYAALVAAAALDFSDALRLVERRGALMQAAVPEGTGAMAAVIGLDDAQVAALCAAYTGEGVLEPANFNSPGQVVVAGHARAIDWVLGEAKTHGARMAVRVPMSVPSHCSLMRGAAEALFAEMAKIELRTPQIPVLHNLDAAPRREPDAIRVALREQLHRPVRWTQTIEALVGDGIAAFVECGPGRVLCGLGKRIAKAVPALPTDDPAAFDKASAAIAAAG
ncbi:ACP S-malonyltransferase [Sinimarinibacterium thermocellulolyticum]